MFFVCTLSVGVGTVLKSYKKVLYKNNVRIILIVLNLKA
jgi:hypothetical protein